MRLRAVIVDDEPRAREVLRHFLSKNEQIEVVGEGASGKEALKLVDEAAPDVIFLDVKMQGMDGLSAAREIVRMTKPPGIIFTTAYEEHAVGAFELEAVDYLVKPYTVQRINEAVQRLISRRIQVMGVPRRISFEAVGVRGDRLKVFIHEESVLFAEARGRHTRIVTPQEEYDVLASLGEVEKWLDRPLFFKTHRSYLVNTAAITGIKSTGRTFGILLDDGHQYGLIPLSRDRVDELKEHLAANGK